MSSERPADMAVPAPFHLRHRGDIDGLRAVAVVSVLLFHADVPGVASGFVGVDVFFVISGFLIMSLLIREVEQDARVALLEFWGRRVRRLAPTLVVCVVVSTLVALLVISPLRWRSIAVDGVWSVLYVSNVSSALGTRGYFLDGLTSPFLHTWSLSVEEQFYVVWPLVVALAARWGAAWRRVLVGVVVVGTGASFVLSVGLSYRGSRWAYFSLPTRWWEIGIGIGAAMLAARWQMPRRATVGVATVGVVMLVVAVAVIRPTTPYPGFAAALPVLGTTALLLSGPSTPVGALLAWRPLQWIGRHSYAWYLWHWPAIVLTTVAVGSATVGVKLGAVGATLPLAVLTGRFVERPIRFRPSLVASPRRSIAVGIVGALLVGLLSVGVVARHRSLLTDPLLARLTAVGDERSADATACYVRGVASDDCASVASGTSVMLIGDSHAAHWIPAMIDATAGLGVNLIVRTRGGCPPWRFSIAATGTDEASAGCAAFLAETDADIAELHPDIVVVTSGEYGGRVLDRTGRTLDADEDDDLVADAVDRRLGELVAEVQNVGVVLDNPEVPFEPIDCLAVERAATPCRFDRSEGFRSVEASRAIQAEAAERHGVAVFDGGAGICGRRWCATDRDGVIVYSDPSHLSHAFVRSRTAAVADFLRPMIAQASR